MKCNNLRNIGAGIQANWRKKRKGSLNEDKVAIHRFCRNNRWTKSWNSSLKGSLRLLLTSCSLLVLLQKSIYKRILCFYCYVKAEIWVRGLQCYMKYCRVDIVRTNSKRGSLAWYQTICIYVGRSVSSDLGMKWDWMFVVLVIFLPSEWANCGTGNLLNHKWLI